LEKKAIDDYYDALQRLIDNRPLHITKGSKINNDTVALEASRKRGSIKKSRQGFEQLINDILEGEAKRTQGTRKIQDKLEQTKIDKINIESLYNKSLNRELMYLETISELEEEIKKNKEPKNNIQRSFI
jgi:mannitol-specific phosphotransferase system IIBC component